METYPQTFTDQMGRAIQLKSLPKRIVSLVPSQTELLYYLGLEKEVVGITKFCIHPKGWLSSKKHVGGTKKINFDTIASLKPDLIIANKEENEKEQIETLSALYPVWISDITTLDEALNMIEGIGTITGTVEKAHELTTEISNKFTVFRQKTLNHPAIKTLYFIWNKPYMLAGKNTFINKMLTLCNFDNRVESNERYPEIDLDTIKLLNPELILLSSEPFPFKEKHMYELQSALPASIIKLVDGEMFSWYGSRLTKAPEYFTALLKTIQEERKRTENVS